jgi:prepilin-type processing-associated H-X9-DG protein
LLVVIAIIAVLLSILLPALSHARRAGRAHACLANVRSLETAHTLYLNDYKEYFVDAGLPHGGLGNAQRSWPVVLGGYMTEAIALRSPGDRSPFWAISEGGTFAGPTFREYLDALADGQPGNDPAPGTLARWTSYGLNDYVTYSHAPPRELMARERYDNLRWVPRPSATVHFLMMTQGLTPQSQQFARSDHVHAEGWDDGSSPPAIAGREMDIAAWGGKPGQRTAKANYGYLDGHAEMQRFDQVYTSFTQNRFYPEIAR